jgi:hypothetical protein
MWQSSTGREIEFCCPSFRYYFSTIILCLIPMCDSLCSPVYSEMTIMLYSAFLLIRLLSYAVSTAKFI